MACGVARLEAFRVKGQSGSKFVGVQGCRVEGSGVAGLWLWWMNGRQKSGVSAKGYIVDVEANENKLLCRLGVSVEPFGDSGDN